VGKKYKLPPGTWIEREMFKSKAYIALTGCAPQLLTLFLAKRQFKNTGRKGKEKRVCCNANNISFTYIEANKEYGIEKKRFTRGIDQLLQKGFIMIVHQGGAYQKDKTQYGLSDKWMLWQPGMKAESRHKDIVSRGYRKPKKNIAVINAPIHTGESAPIGGNLEGRNRTQGKINSSLQ